MSHIDSIGAGLYSDLSVTNISNQANVLSAINAVKADATTAETELKALFADSTKFERIKNIRELPAMGTAPNVVNVPVFGQKVSKQVQGQADAPSFEIQLNYVASDWEDDDVLYQMVGDGKLHVFRFSILNSRPKGYTNNEIHKLYGTDTANSCQNSEYYFWGKMEAFQVTPQLTDATTATLTISIQSEFFGAYTISANS